MHCRGPQGVLVYHPSLTSPRGLSTCYSQVSMCLIAWLADNNFNKMNKTLARSNCI